MVDTAKISDWLQIIGMFGVIASLTFVGLQMKQAQQIALSSTYQARSAATVDSLMAAVSSPEFLSASAKIYANKFELPLNRQMMKNWFYRESFMNVIDEIVDQVGENITGCWNPSWSFPLAE